MKWLSRWSKGMRRSILLPLAVCVAVPAKALVIDTYPDWTGSITGGWLAQAQNFIGPSDNVLNSWRFSLAAGTGNVTFSIFNWSASGPVGSALFSTTAPWPSTDSPVDINNINLTLVQGNSYGAVVDLQGQSGNSVHFNNNQNSYNLGNGWWMNSAGWNNFAGLNQTFRAVFSPVPEPASMIAIGVGLAGLFARRKRRSS